MGIDRVAGRHDPVGIDFPGGGVCRARQAASGRDIAVFDLRGLTVKAVAGSQNFSSPRWVDDDTVVAVRAAGAESGTIVEVDVGNLTRTPVPRDLFTETEIELVATSLDGERILFVAGVDLFISDRDGANREQVSEGVGLFNADLFEPG